MVYWVISRSPWVCAGRQGQVPEFLVQVLQVCDELGIETAPAEVGGWGGEHVIGFIFGTDSRLNSTLPFSVN